LVRLWREKRGEVEPEDLSGNLVVQLGIATEELNRRWYEANTGQVVTDVQKRVRHPALRWMGATLDGRITDSDAVFEAKFMLPWSFSEEAAAEKYMPQLQHNMWVVAASSAVLSVITGGGKWVEIVAHADPLYQHLIVTAERKFWRCVESGEQPQLFDVEPPKPRLAAVRIVDMTPSNAWAEFAAIFGRTRAAHLEHEQAKVELKSLMPEDAKEAIGHGIRAKRSKSGAVSFDLLATASGRAVMQRSSPSIAALATALAKAQIELANPEKSLTGTIEPQGGEGSARQFCYAPLSSGLEIVRKTLGQHEIATVQTTAIDQAAGFVNLTTVLAHSSGEWMASDWPVCAIAETATPRRIGAALTYARRYALFTLVGIAGEDDVDAPDLIGSSQPTSARDRRVSRGNGQLDARAATLAARTPLARPQSRPGETNNSKAQLRAAVRLDQMASATLRDQMLGELNEIGGGDEAAKWAQRRLKEKNKLNAIDAKHVEEAFRVKLLSFAIHQAEGGEAQKANAKIPKRKQWKSDAKSAMPSTAVDKSVLMHPEPRRVRDRDHVRFVARQTCLVCGRHPCDAHHLRFAQNKALSRKVSDEFTVPLCRGHHRELHRDGDEAAWWQKLGLDPTGAARALWLETHPQIAENLATQLNGDDRL
jgi:hypothetical protein